MRRLYSWQCWGKPAGVFMVRIIPAILVFSLFLRIAAGPLHLRLAEFDAPAFDQRAPSSFGRTGVAAQLNQLPDRQLVLVRYRSDHNPFHEWVYNEANIDAAQVVWAHDMGAAENNELISYFARRNTWLLDADQTPPRLSAYPSFPSPSSNEL